MGKKLFCYLSIVILLSTFLVICNVAGKSVASQSNWWDKWGEPQYGGTLNFRAEFIDIITEPHDPRSSQFGWWFEVLWCDNMVLDRDIFSFKTNFTPAEYRQGWLAETWEQPDPLTWRVHLRKGVRWQNKEPTFGREFTAEDVQFSYDRLLAKGEFEGGSPNAFYGSLIPNIDRVIAKDKYTVEFQLNNAGPLVAYQVMGPFLSIGLVPREWAALGPPPSGGPPKGGPPKGGSPKGGSPTGKTTPLQDWRNCTGTGAFICSDFVPGTSLTVKRNPDYWGFDERHPENRLPYLDAVKVLVIPDMATALAAMRTGKLDQLADGRSFASLAQAQSLRERNPDIVQYQWLGGAPGVFYKYNTKPFDDIRVRKAMQLAINIPEIAKTYYRGTVDGKPCGMSHPDIGEDWVVPYDKWPKELQEEYSYNPEKAKQLLAEAGFPNGFKTEILASPTDNMELLQILKSYFTAIGVDMDIKAMDIIQARTMILDGKYNQMIYGGGGGGGGGPDVAIGSFWSKKFERTGGGGGVNDPYYDSLVDKFYAATDIEETQRIYKEAERYALEQHYTAVVCPTLTTQLGQPWLKGWNGESFWGTWGMAYYSRFWIDSSLKK